jgi:hypothetical protein
MYPRAVGGTGARGAIDTRHAIVAPGARVTRGAFICRWPPRSPLARYPGAMRTCAEWLDVAAQRGGVDPADGAEALRRAEAAAQHPEDWLRIAEHLSGVGDRERARAALARTVDQAIERYGVRPFVLYRAAALLAKRLGDREGAALVLRRFELGLDPYGRAFDWGILAKAHLEVFDDELAAGRCLDEAERRCASPEGLATLAGFYVECGRPRERALELLERAEATHSARESERDFSSIMSAWQKLGDEARAQSLLERVTEESEQGEVLLSAARAWWFQGRDEERMLRALRRAESFTASAEAWLALAGAYRDGGDSERAQTWDADGVRRCLEGALASEPTSDERTAIAASYRRWLGDLARATELAQAIGEREPRARVRAGLEGWDGSQPFELFELLRARLDPDDVEELATAESHQDVARHLEGLEEILRAPRLELPLQGHPFFALESASWDTGERTNHLARAFACTVLLLDGQRIRSSDTIAVLVESAWQIEVDEPLERFLGWLSEVLPIHELGWAMLGLALCTARRDPHSLDLGSLVDGLAALRVHHTDGCVDPDWVYPAEYGQRNPLWAELVEQALAGSDSTEVDRLRALLRTTGAKPADAQPASVVLDAIDSSQPEPLLPPATEAPPRATSSPAETVWHWVRHARDDCRSDPAERDRALGEAARIAVTAKDLVQVAYHLGWLGGDRALGRELAERGEAMTIAAGDRRELWSVAIAWKHLGDEARARAMLALGVDSTRDASVAKSFSTAWRSLFDDDAGVRLALARAEEQTSTASQWLDLAEAYRDGGDSNRAEAWDRAGVVRSLEAALLARPSDDDRIRVANAYRQWLGDDERADAIALAGRTHEEVPRMRKALPGWDTSRPSELWDAVVALLEDGDLEHIATSDYGQSAPKHLAALRTMIATKRVPRDLPWHPREVVALTSWSKGPSTNHRARAFACLVLLVGEGDEVTIANSLAPLLESADLLGLDDALERHVAWLAEIVPVGELGVTLLGLALCTVRRDPSAPALTTLVDKLTSLQKPRRDWPRGRWSYPADGGQQQALWAELVEQALAGADSAEVARLRSLLT